MSNINTNLVQKEANRIYKNLQKLGWTMQECLQIAPKTLLINNLKKEQNAIILAHSYQSPDIMYAVADFIGDSYGLSKLASQSTADKIIFSSVYFMGETAKLLNPEKQVLVPSVAGCSLADSITAQDVKNLKKKHPGVHVVCYINTTAAVKAESDICCTSSNSREIVESQPGNKVIFIPDKLMGQNLQKETSKELILWDGTCIVHEMFTPAEIDLAKKTHPDVKILVHLECDPEVVKRADLAGSTKDMIDYVKKSKAQTFMLVTECGITDRINQEIRNKKVVGGCNFCPFMRSLNLDGILKALQNPSQDQIIKIQPEIFKKARKTIDKMFEIVEKKPSL